MDSPSKTLALLMNQASEGRRSAADRLLPLVRDELRNPAGGKLKNEPTNLTLQATALVHEAYLRLGGSEEEKWQSRRHYFAAAADIDLAAGDEPARWLALDEGLAALAQHDPELGELVSLRFFAGLSVDQIAAALAISPRTVDNHWKVARAFLLKRMESPVEKGERSGGGR